MLMILSKLYQDIKQEKNRRLVGFCFSLHTKAASRGNLFFCVQYICEISSRLANGLLPGSQWEDHSKSPFVFATVKKTLLLTSEISRRSVVLTSEISRRSVVCARPDRTL